MRAAILTVVLLAIALPVRSEPEPPATVVCRLGTSYVWVFWWAYNRDDLLSIKAAVKAREEGDPTTVRAIREQIVPALKRILMTEGVHPDIRGSAIIALARAEPGQERFEQCMAIAAAKDVEDPVVRESAIMALAISDLPDPAVRDFLIGLAADREERLRLRCFALLALGILGHGDELAARAFLDAVTARDSDPELVVSALHAIGVNGDPSFVPHLTGWLSSGRAGTRVLDDRELSWVIAALGRIGEPDTRMLVASQLRAAGPHARRSAAIAVGQLAPRTTVSEQRDAVAALAGFLTEEQDQAARIFAVYALGRIGGNDRTTGVVRSDVVGVLERAFRETGEHYLRSYIALAMGLVGRVDAAPDALRAELAGILRPELGNAEAKESLGAFAIALGMLRDRNSVQPLGSILADPTRRALLRGASAIGLALIGDPDADSRIRGALGEREDPDLQAWAATAAALLGTPGAVEALVARIEDENSSRYARGNAALALGPVGDRRAIDALLAIVEPGKANGAHPDLTRALAVVALGQIADRRDLPVLFRLRKDVNYRSTVAAIDEVLCIL